MIFYDCIGLKCAHMFHDLAVIPELLKLHLGTTACTETGRVWAAEFHHIFLSVNLVIELFNMFDDVIFLCFFAVTPSLIDSRRFSANFYFNVIANIIACCDRGIRIFTPTCIYLAIAAKK